MHPSWSLRELYALAYLDGLERLDERPAERPRADHPTPGPIEPQRPNGGDRA